jgi:predicted TIM-barrel fold metal-dependent hydrolase
MENEGELNEFIEAPFNSRYITYRQLLPTLDGFHTPNGLPRRPGTFDPSVGPERWLEFLERTGTDYTVLYPTQGLAYGHVVYPNWALGYARTYNNWLHNRYLKFSPRLKGVALIPMQDVSCAVAELRRAVKELGMVGAMVPSNGLNKHISAKEYWPI